MKGLQKYSYALGKSEGYLLLELILAMVFISIALVGLINGFTTSIKTHNYIGDQNQSLLLMESKFNEIELEGIFEEGTREGEFVDPKNFKWKTEIRKTDTPSLYRVEVTIFSPLNTEHIVAYLREQKFNEY